MRLLFDTSEYIDRGQILVEAERLSIYIHHLRSVASQDSYDDVEASLNLSCDSELLDEVESLVSKKVTSALKYIFVVGIGGSNLGTKAVYDAIYSMEDMLPSKRPKMIFVDTNNTKLLAVYTKKIIPKIKKAEQMLLITISKSGGTIETLANTEILLDALKVKIPDIKKRVVVITDEGSDYWNVAKKNRMAHLAIPKNVGGRYSVLSAVGLFPLAALGLDIKDFLRGAQDIRPYCLNIDVEHNPAAQSAAILSHFVQNGKSINDNFIFNSELESLGKWYRQLMGESVGKEHDTSGDVVHAGLTPTISIGSTDLHSVGQLYLGGPRDKITTFIYSTDTGDSIPVPDDRVFPSVVEMINKKDTDDIMDAILGGVKIAYNKNKLPYMEIQLSGITPYEIGAFMQFKMIEMMYLGNLLDVNAFDQPNVESYKTETKQLLET